MEPVTKERLARYISLKKENENRLERLARMRSNAELPVQWHPDGAKHTGSSGDRMARAVEACMEYEEQIRPLIEANCREMKAIEEAVAALPDPMEREVLRLRYMDSNSIRPFTWREIALCMYGSDGESQIRSLMYLHQKALSHISDIFN